MAIRLHKEALLETKRIRSGYGDEMEVFDVTDIDIREIIKLAYENSNPLGKGWIHFIPGQLTDEEVDEIIEKQSASIFAVSIDYIKGRSVKLTIHNVTKVKREHGLYPEGMERFIPIDWFDHTTEQLEYILDKAVKNEEGN